MIFSSSVFDVNGYLMWWNILIQHLFLNGVRYLEKVKACDDVAVVDMAALGWVCELTLWVSAWAAASLKLPTHLQCQPFNITHSRQSHWHFTHNASESVVLWRRVADGKSRVRDVNHTAILSTQHARQYWWRKYAGKYGGTMCVLKEWRVYGFGFGSCDPWKYFLNDDFECFRITYLLTMQIMASQSSFIKAKIFK